MWFSGSVSGEGEGRRISQPRASYQFRVMRICLTRATSNQPLIPFFDEHEYGQAMITVQTLKIKYEKGKQES